MRNSFLIFSILFVFGLLIFLGYPQISLAQQAATVNPGAVGAGLTTANASGTITGAGSGGASGYGFVWGTVSGIYNATSSKFTGALATSSEFGWEITNGGTYNSSNTLSKGTFYYLKTYASTSVSTVYGNTELTFLAGIDDPANLKGTSADQNSINLSWTKGTGAGKTVVRYSSSNWPASSTDSNAGCTTDSTSCTVSGLNCGQVYYIRAWSSTTATLSTTSNSFSFTGESAGRCLTSGTGAGGRTLLGPTTYPDSLVINKDAKSTKTREVELSLKADGAQYVVISTDTLFLNPLEVYSATKKWTLTEGDGVKTVYAKFVSQDGLNSDIVSDTIILETAVESVPTPAPVALAPTPESTTPTPTVEPTPVPIEKPISEMSKEELAAKIAEILAQVEVLKTQLAEQLKEVVVFGINLKYNDKGNQVLKLQEVLIKEGILAEGLNTGWFGSLTKAAVIKFQEKYASEILTPNGLTKGTGFVGSFTRAKLNELISF